MFAIATMLLWVHRISNVQLAASLGNITGHLEAELAAPSKTGFVPIQAPVICANVNAIANS